MPRVGLVIIVQWEKYLLNLPSRLEISELCIFGLSCAILRRWRRDQTMKAFIGRLMWSDKIPESPPLPPGLFPFPGDICCCIMACCWWCWWCWWWWAIKRPGEDCITDMSIIFDEIVEVIRDIEETRYGSASVTRDWAAEDSIGEGEKRNTLGLSLCAACFSKRFVSCESSTATGPSHASCTPFWLGWRGRGWEGGERPPAVSGPATRMHSARHWPGRLTKWIEGRRSYNNTSDQLFCSSPCSWTRMNRMYPHPSSTLLLPAFVRAADRAASLLLFQVPCTEKTVGHYTSQRII